MLTGLIGAPLILGITYVNGALFIIVAGIAGLIGSYELAHMIRPHNRLTALRIVSTVIIGFAGIALDQMLLLLVAGVVFVVMTIIEAVVLPDSDFRRHFVYALIGTIYISLALGVLVQLRMGDDGLLWTIMLFLNNWATDSFALIGGRMFGKRKLAPTISPGKTVEGAAVGLTSGVIFGVVVALLGGVPAGIAIVINIIVALATETGDLIESMVKRHLHVKDSGHILPGHGGILDRMDGTLLAAPTLFILLALTGI